MHWTHSSLASNWSLFPIKNSVSLFRRPQITKQMLIPAASFWLLLWKPKLVICVPDHNPYCQLDHPSHPEALIPAYYSAFWDHLFEPAALSDGACGKQQAAYWMQPSNVMSHLFWCWRMLNSRSIAVCVRRVSWERDISVNWLSQGWLSSFIRPSETEWHVFW